MYKVLLADDEKVICEGLKALVDWTSLGFEICASARNGIEILRLAETYKPHLLIADIKMPKMDGLEAVNELRRKNFDMEILILTGFADFEYARGALEQGACGYLMKPVDDEELESQLRQIAVRLKHNDETRLQREGRYLLALCRRETENSEPIPSPALLAEDKYTLISVEPVLSGKECDASSIAELERYFMEYDHGCQSAELYGDLITFRLSRLMNRIWIAPFETGYMIFLRGGDWDLSNKLHKFMAGRKNVRLIVGETVNGLSAIDRSFETLENGRHQYFYSEYNKNIIFYKNCPNKATVQYEPLDIETVISNIEAYKLDEALKALNEIGNQMRERRYALPLVETYANLFITRLALFMDETCQMGLEMYRIGEKLKAAVRHTQLDDLLSLLEVTLSLAYAETLDAGKEADMGIVKEVINYLKEKISGENHT